MTLWGAASPEPHIHRLTVGSTAPVLVAELNAPAVDTDPTFSADGLVVYFYSERGRALYNGSIYRATRTTTSGTFDAPSEVTDIPRGNGWRAPGTLSPDNCRLYFYFYGSDMAGAAESVLYVAERLP